MAAIAVSQTATFATASSAKASSSKVSAAKAAFLQGRALRQSKAITVSAAAKSSTVSAEERPLWFPGSTAPAWLDGSLPGDYGFDPLGLGSDPELLKWFAQAELVHARWAMLAAAGIFIPDLLTKIGILDVPFWYTAGEQTYFADQTTLFHVELAFMGWAEGRRWVDILKPGSVNVDPVFPANKLTGTDVGYPGGLWFDPFGYGSGDAAKVRTFRVKEIANGRLAMLAVMGAWGQAFHTGARPIENLLAHIADPGHVTIIQTLSQ